MTLKYSKQYSHNSLDNKQIKTKKKTDKHNLFDGGNNNNS